LGVCVQANRMVHTEEAEGPEEAAAVLWFLWSSA
jgi:hypothetical protein